MNGKNRVVVFGMLLGLCGAACSPTTGEGVSGCRGDGDCPAAFPVCRADLRCWSTPDPAVDAALLDTGALREDASTDDDAARPVDAARVGVDAFVVLGPDAAIVPDDAAVESADAYAPPGVDAATTVMPDAATTVMPDAATTVTPDAATTVMPDAGRPLDGGGPCGGGPTTTFYRDTDGDGHGAAASGTMMRCSAGGGYVASNDDCDDSNPGRYPGNTELCNSIDDDCAGGVDGAGADAACTVSGGTGRCDMGVCEVASCSGTRRDCDAAFANGCEIDTSTSAAHCGACGVSCSLADSCSASSCNASPWVQVDSQATTTCARRMNGNVVCWGYNRAGIVDATPGTYTASLSPRMVPGVTGATDIAVGENAACAVVSGGGVMCWGNSTSGALGPDAPAAAIVGATTVSGTGTCVDVEVTSDSGTTACAVRASGAVMCWGVSLLLGDGSAPTFRAMPGPVTGITTARSIESAAYTPGFCVLRSDNRVSCWSRNQQMCGDGSATPCPTPVTATPTGVARLHGMAQQFCATLTDGSSQCWGSMLLPTTGGDASVWGPTSLGISGVTAGGAAGVGVRCVATAARTECWGANGADGYLGRGTTTPGPLATGAVTGGVIASSLTGNGGSHICAIAGGAVRCWGSNAALEMGTAGPSRTSPFLVLGP